MKIISVMLDSHPELFVRGFGFEDNSDRACWGRGVREVCIIHYVLSGFGYFNGKRVGSGEGFVITPGMLHEYHSSRAEPWSYFWVVIDGVEAVQICKNNIACDEDHIFAYDFRPRLLSLCDSIMSEDGEICEMRALGYLYLLLSYHRQKAATASNGYVRSAILYIETNFHRPISVTEVSEFVGIDDRYLYNLFIKHVGKSPKSYISALRLERAENMLRQTDANVSEIAVSVGFIDVLSFSKFFSKNKGISPLNYRKVHRKLK